MSMIACVLRSGGDFAPAHAARLYGQFLAHSPPATEFLCLTDLRAELEDLHVPWAALEHGWPGWWSKLEAFRLPGPILYLDLDVTITGDLTPLLVAATQHDLVACAGFWGAEDPNKINSSVMAWRGDVSSIYRAFLASPEVFARAYHQRNKPQKWGDQAFIRDHWGAEIVTWNDLLPGMVMSFKREVLMKRSLWADARVIVSHGKPRPWDWDGADAWLAARRRAA